MEAEQKEKGIPMSTSHNGVNFGILDHNVRFVSKSRVCIHCGKQLKANQRALGIITCCPQTLPNGAIPGNFFIHAECSGALQENMIDKELLGMKIDEIVNEYKIVREFIKKYGSKWGLNYPALKDGDS